MGRLGNGKFERKVASGYLSVLSPGKPFFPWCCGLWPASVSRRETDVPDVPDAVSLPCIPGSGNATQTNRVEITVLEEYTTPDSRKKSEQRNIFVNSMNDISIPRKRSEQREHLGSSVDEMYKIGLPRKRSERACLGSSMNAIYNNSLSMKKSEQRNPSVSSLNEVFSTTVPKKQSEQQEPSVSSLNEVVSTTVPRKKSEKREPLVSCLNEVVSTTVLRKRSEQRNPFVSGLNEVFSTTAPRNMSEQREPPVSSLNEVVSTTVPRKKSEQQEPLVSCLNEVFSTTAPRKTSEQRNPSTSCLNVPLLELQKPSDNEDDTSISKELFPAPMPHQPAHSKSASPSPPRSESLASMSSGASESQYGTVAVRGEVEFGLQYNYKASALEIHVKQCRDLAPVDLKRNRSDPYVKVYLLPDKSKSGKRKTKVKKHALNPVFYETLKFHMTLHELETRTLWLTVWRSDRFGRNDFLGEVMMALENKVFDDPTPQWYHLQERREPFEDLLSYKGDIIIGLKFIPPDVTVKKKGKQSRGSLHVLVKEAKNLVAVKANGKSDPFCKSYLLPDKGRSSKQKTPIRQNNVNPVWNYTFVYEDVSLQVLLEKSLELTVWDHDRLASNKFLGGLRFNLGTGKHYGKGVDWMDATGKEMTLWQSMLERPNFWVEGSLALRPSLEQHRTS